MTKPNRLLLATAILFAAAGYARLAPAATDLPMVCTDPAAAGKPVNVACGGRTQTGQVYKTPSDTDLVRINPGATSADWESERYIWAAWKDLSPGDWYDRCKTDLPEGARVDQQNCTDWGMVQKAAPAAPVFTVTPTSGRAPLTVTVAWNVPAGTACQAGGAWSGTKPAASSEQVALQAGTPSITLTCTRQTGPPATGSAQLTWTAPTQNTDGSSYSDPAGYQLYSGTSTPPQVKTRLAAPGTVSRTFGGLAPNTIQYFAIAAVNAAGVEGEVCCSPAPFKWIANTPTPQPWTGSQAVTVDAPVIAKPKAPVLTVQ
jgi:hypothetical protein